MKERNISEMPNKKSVKMCRKSRNCRKKTRARGKLFKNRTGNSDRVKSEEKVSSDRGTVPVTPQMIRLAVKELHLKKVYVSSSLIADHLRRFYPIESNTAVLQRELDEKLDDAVSVGLIAKCGPDAYCLPTLRQQATSHKTDFTRFWERYNKRGSQNRRVNCLENPRKKLRKRLQDRFNEHSDNKDEDSDIV